jgi:transcriptional regulator with XRE-family HTH domain
MAKRKLHTRIKRRTAQAQRLCEFRQHRRWTFQELALQLGKKESYASALCSMETGRRTVPDVIVRQLANLYDVRPEALRAGQLEFDLLKGITKPSELPTGILGDVTQEEREELLRYLSFLRLKKAQAR